MKQITNWLSLIISNHPPRLRQHTYLECIVVLCEALLILKQVSKFSTREETRTVTGVTGSQRCISRPNGVTYLPSIRTLRDFLIWRVQLHGYPFPTRYFCVMPFLTWVNHWFLHRERVALSSVDPQASSRHCIATLPPVSCEPSSY